MTGEPRILEAWWELCLCRRENQFPGGGETSREPFDWRGVSLIEVACGTAAHLFCRGAWIGSINVNIAVLFVQFGGIFLLEGVLWSLTSRKE